MKQIDIIEDLMLKVKSFVDESNLVSTIDNIEKEILRSDLHAKLDKIENEIRSTWAGATPYISKRNMKNVKECAIRKLNSGLSVRQVSEQSGLSISSIYTILRKKR